MFYDQVRTQTETRSVLIEAIFHEHIDIPRRTSVADRLQLLGLPDNDIGDRAKFKCPGMGRLVRHDMPNGAEFCLHLCRLTDQARFEHLSRFAGCMQDPREGRLKVTDLLGGRMCLHFAGQLVWVQRLKRAGAVALAVGLGACAAYHEEPLSGASMLRTSVASLQGLSPGTRAISVAQIDRLVLANNPALVAARTQLGVAQAQVLQARLLPDPQVTGAYPFLVGGPGTVDAFNAGLNQDVRSLITLSARTEGAEASAAQINASLLWQEWQVIGRARLLVIDLIEGERLQSVLNRSHATLNERYRLTEKAIRDGNATLATI